jgi:RNA polymerase sigma factor (sigma-70 family)
MGQQTTVTVLERLSTLFDQGALGRLSDARLIERFVAGGAEAEAAFKVLVERHGLMVRGVCRTLLGEPHAADDAFQATFLVLARRAGSIRDGDALASWLYGVSCRVARKARAHSARQRTIERRAAASRLEAVSPPSDEPAGLGPDLFEEVGRLPERYRAPIILCYIDGQTHQQAAGALRCPVRTLQTRLLRGKARLRSQLVRRGLAPAAALVLLDRLSSGAAEAMASSVPDCLIESCASAALRFAAVGSVTMLLTTRPAAAPETLALELLGGMRRRALSSGFADLKGVN